MDSNNNQYGEEETLAALALMMLAAPKTASTEPEEQNNRPSDNASTEALDDSLRFVIDESLTADEDVENKPARIVKAEDEYLPAEEEDAEGVAAEGEEPMEPELLGILANDTTANMITRMTQIALKKNSQLNTSRVPEERTLRQRLERFINEEEVKGAKYHTSMKRFYASAANRSVEKQISRDKNNTASRLSRLRMNNAETNLRIAANELEDKNRAQRMKNAALLDYLRHLHVFLKLVPVNFQQCIPGILASYKFNTEKMKAQCEKFKEELTKKYQ